MTKQKKPKKSSTQNQKIVIEKDGPYHIFGSLPLAKEIITTDKEGYSVKWEKGESYPNQTNYKLCRCGESKDKPYCDKTHLKISFDGTETAHKDGYIYKANVIEGPELILTDEQDLCANARFCDRAGGTWELTKKSDNPRSKKTAIQESCDCPSGRLETWDKKSGNVIEPKFEPQISLVEDPAEKVSGPIWIKGAVTTESSGGQEYEIRNRVTLCRCGKSNNKPFCDGTHSFVKFKDSE